MPRLVGKGKEYAKIGHKLETPLLEELLNHPRNPHKILQILRPGLVAKDRDHLYAKTSVDAIGVIEADEGLELIGIEIKVRASSATRQNELDRRRGNSDDELFTDYEIDSLEERYGVLYDYLHCSLLNGSHILSLYFTCRSIHIREDFCARRENLT